MLEPSVALALLSLFTTPQKAAEIEGDLIEQARDRGSIWYAYHVALTALSLFRAAILRSFVFVALLSYATYELCAKTFFWGIRPFRWYIEFELGLARSPTISLTYGLVVLFTFLVGGSLVRFLPSFGATVAVGAIALFFLRLAVLQEGYTILQVTLCVAAPMLAGSFLANWMSLQRDWLTRVARR